MPESPSRLDWTGDLDLEAAERLARRPWPAPLLRSALEVSFEFFPPATEAASSGFRECVNTLEPLNPAFVSVTYGAGGTTQDRTLRSLGDLVRRTALPVAGHLTCVGATRKEVHRVIDEYAALGVSRIVALRGDAPDGSDDGTVEGGYGSALELVEGIRARHDGDDFDISVAAYPEVHPRALSAAADLENLKRKVEAGADRVITQFFFDNEAFLRFHDCARAHGIDVPIVPGVMPVTNFAGVVRFAGRCGTRIPEWMHELFGNIDEDSEIQHLVAATVAAEQCRHLAEHGISRFHFYTMNRPQLTAATCRILGVRASVPASAELAS